MSKIGGLYILKKKTGLADKEGYLKKPRLVFTGMDGDGKEMELDQGEYTGFKFPSAKEDIVPQYDPSRKAWDFYGEAKDLNRLVKAIELYYPKGHPKAGQLIVEANLRNNLDAFFNNSFWFDNAMTLDGSAKLLNADDPKTEFLLRCHLGNKYTENSFDETNPLVSASMKYIISRSSDEDADTIKQSNLEIDLIAKLAGISVERAKEISVIMGLLNSFDTKVPVDSIKPNLAKAIVKTAINPGDKKIFEGKSYMTFFTELVKDDNITINKKLNIRLAIVNNTLRYKDGAYLLKGKKLPAATFSELYKYFSTDGEADYAELLDAR